MATYAASLDQTGAMLCEIDGGSFAMRQPEVGGDVGGARREFGLQAGKDKGQLAPTRA